jgi:hypothetical protein
MINSYPITADALVQKSLAEATKAAARPILSAKGASKRRLTAEEVLPNDAAGKDSPADGAKSDEGDCGEVNGAHPRKRWRCMQPRQCVHCFKTFSNSFNLKQHTINVHVQSVGVACHLCEKVVKNKWYLRKHLVTAHHAPLKRNKGAMETVDAEEGVAQKQEREEPNEEDEEEDNEAQ